MVKKLLIISHLIFLLQIVLIVVAQVEGEGVGLMGRVKVRDFLQLSQTLLLGLGETVVVNSVSSYLL